MGESLLLSSDVAFNERPFSVSSHLNTSMNDLTCQGSVAVVGLDQFCSQLTTDGNKMPFR